MKHKKPRLKLNCAYCGKPVFRLKCECFDKNVYCSKTCFYKNIKVANSIKTKERFESFVIKNNKIKRIKEKPLNVEEMLKTKKFVLERDNYTCQECGKRGVKLHVHHIDKSQVYGFWQEANNNPKNLISLCELCHLKKHLISKCGRNEILVNKLQEIKSMRNSGMTLRQIGKIFDVSYQRIQQILSKHFKYIK